MKSHYANKVETPTSGAKYCTPEINTSESIVDFQWYFPMDFQRCFPAQSHFPAVFSEGLSLVQWIFTGSFAPTPPFHLNLIVFFVSHVTLVFTRFSFTSLNIYFLRFFSLFAALPPCRGAARREARQTGPRPRLRAPRGRRRSANGASLCSFVLCGVVLWLYFFFITMFLCYFLFKHVLLVIFSQLISFPFHQASLRVRDAGVCIEYLW